VPDSNAIPSLLDTDLYKLTMMQCIMHQFPDVPVGYRLILRKPIDLRPCSSHIQSQIHALCQLRFQESELGYLESLGYFKADFLDYLRTFSLPEKAITLSDDNATLSLKIEGSWKETILFEVPLLAILSEAYYRQHVLHPDYDEGKRRLQSKIDYIKSQAPGIHFSEFGTRRRFSHAWQKTVIETLQQELPNAFIGTSNVYFAKHFNLRPMGTMAHEFLQACQVLAPHIQGSQRFALQAWLKEYPDALGIALTDSLTLDVFLSEFDKTLAQRYEGLRQDSGDPIQWGEKVLAHYRTLGIDPSNKTFVFSDNLNAEKASAIYHHFKKSCHPIFGIGTNLTNDLGYASIDIVLKMIHTHHLPVIKITDSPGKTVCDDPSYLEKVKTIFNIKDPTCA
jgi:nicotinate phosphoribosyltransferase